MEYNVQSKTIHGHAVHMGIDRAYITADEIDFSKEQIIAKEAQVGINLGLSGAVPNLRAKNFTYDRLKKWGVGKNIRVRIGKVPIMGLPYLAVGDWVRFIDVHWDNGYKKELGCYLRSEICYNIYKDLHFGMLCDVYGKRGMLLGPVMRIDGNGETFNSRLDLQTGYISDHGNRGSDIGGKPIGKHRWFVDLEQSHHWERIDLLSDFLWTSDGGMGRDFDRLGEEWEVRDSFGELDYRGEKDLWTVFTRVKANNYQDFAQEIPSLRLERFPQEIFESGFYYFGYIDFTRQKFRREDFFDSGELGTVERNRFDTYWGIHRPTEMGRGNQFTPLVGGRWTHYGEECDRFLGEFGFDWEANFYAIYPQQISWLGAKEWKHNLRPVIQYRHIVGNGKGTRYPVDRKGKNDFLSCIDLGEMRHVDHITEQDTLRIGLENDFFAKDRKDRIRSIASLDFYQDFRFRRSCDSVAGNREKSLSDFYIFSEFNPRRWLNLRLYTRLHWQHFSLKEINVENNFIDGDYWQLGLRGRFLKHRREQLAVNFTLQLNELSRFAFETQFDIRNNRFLAVELGYTTHWSGVWDVKLFCKIKRHSKRQRCFQPGFSINLMRW
jgi:hypothetical protein